MKPGKFFGMFEKGFGDLWKNPLVIIPGVMLGVFFSVLSELGWNYAYGLSTTTGNVVYTILVALVSLFAMGYIFSGLIGMSKKIVEGKKAVWKDFSSNAGKFWFRNFVVLLVIAVVSIVIERVAFYGAFFIGRIFDLGVGAAQFVFILIYFIGLIGVLIFLTFSSFYLVLEGLIIVGSMRKSVRLVKKEYLATLSLIVILFVVLFLLNSVSGFFGDILEYAFFVPLLALVLVRFVLNKDKF